MNATRPVGIPDAGRPRIGVLFAGTVFLDIVLGGLRALPAPGAEEWAATRAVSPGGIANAAVAAARLGMPTALVTTVGEDELSGLVLGMLKAQENLDLSAVKVDRNRQLPLTVVVPIAGERAFLSHGTLCEPAPQPPLLDASVLFVALNDGIPSWTAHFREQGTIVVAGVGWEDAPDWPAQVAGYLDQVDVLVLNATEARMLTGARDLDAAARDLAGPDRAVVITDGANGCRALPNVHNSVLAVPSPTVAASDTTGAGDVFIGALTSALAAGADLSDGLELACVAAADATTRSGGAAAAPTPHQVLERASTASVAPSTAARIAALLSRSRFLHPALPEE